MVDQVDDLRIELHCIDRGRFVVERLQHVRACARAEHQDARVRSQRIRGGRT
jgi:hypothetical protein